MNTAIIQGYISTGKLTVSIDIVADDREVVRAPFMLADIAKLLKEHNVCVCRVDFIDVVPQVIERIKLLMGACDCQRVYEDLSQEIEDALWARFGEGAGLCECGAIVLAGEGYGNVGTGQRICDNCASAPIISNGQITKIQHTSRDYSASNKERPYWRGYKTASTYKGFGNYASIYGMFYYCWYVFNAYAKEY